MRRIARLRRPSGLHPTSTIPRATAGPSISSQRFSSSSPILTSRRVTPISAYPSNLSRFYSTKDSKPTTTEELESVTSQFAEPLEAEDDLSLVEDLDTIEGAEEYEETWTPYVVPQELRDASSPADIADVDYKPATDGSKLETVGGVAKWWDAEDHWHSSGNFVSFRPKEKITDAALLEINVRRAVVEALALRQSGGEDKLLGLWNTDVPKEDLMKMLGVEVKSDATIGGDAQAVAEMLEFKPVEVSLEEGSVFDAAPETIGAEEAKEIVESWDQSWKSVQLADPRLRFAVTKRVFQLTGHLIPDHRLPLLSDVSSVLQTITTPPKPVTLTQEIQENRQELVNMPNVSVATKRVTKAHKEEKLGRLKIMQAELEKRGLPLWGHGGAMKGKNLQWLKGGA
ncbi:ribosomal subunit 39S-domain-containing protein [Xylariaceae sp. FL1272]|nr:ribosomal subunit 39S-domain-containing protein [Xylariaceae sp. FL1272]